VKKIKVECCFSFINSFLKYPAVTSLHEEVTHAGHLVRTNEAKFQSDITYDITKIIEGMDFQGYKGTNQMVTSNYDEVMERLNKQELTDVILEVEDIYGTTKQFEYHKSVLCSRSGFFEGRFLFNTQESRIQHETPLSIQSFECLINFFYKDELSEQDNADYLLLLKSLDFYQLNKEEEDKIKILIKTKLKDLEKTDIFEILVSHFTGDLISEFLEKDLSNELVNFPKLKLENYLIENNKKKQELNLMIAPLLDQIKGELSSLRTEMQSVKNEIGDIKSDINNLKGSSSSFYIR